MRGSSTQSTGQATNRLIVGLVVAAIVVGLSLVLRATDLPIAVLVGFYAIYDILRHGRIFRR